MVVMPPAPGIASLDLTSPTNEDVQALALTERSSKYEHLEGDTGHGRSVPVEEGRIADYASIRASTLEWAYAQNGIQEGDASKTAKAIVDVVRGEGLAAPSRLPKAVNVRMNGDGAKADLEQPWPELLVLGNDAEQNIRERCQNVLQCLDEWKDVTRSIKIEE